MSCFFFRLWESIAQTMYLQGAEAIDSYGLVRINFLFDTDHLLQPSLLHKDPGSI